jgi:uroporphyrinogen decarboxylase
LQTLNFEQADPPFVRASGAWQETLDLWRKQGWDGRPFDEIFGTDTLVRVDVYYGPAPAFPYQVVEEDERTRVYVNHEGILMREFKEHRDTSMPLFVKFPVVNEDNFDCIAVERLGLNEAFRFSEEWKHRVTAWKGSVSHSTISQSSWSA